MKHTLWKAKESAEIAEAMLKVAKFQLELQDWKNTGPVHLEAKLASAQVEKLETEMKLEKTIFERKTGQSKP